MLYTFNHLHTNFHTDNNMRKLKLMKPNWNLIWIYLYIYTYRSRLAEVNEFHVIFDWYKWASVLWLIDSGPEPRLRMMEAGKTHAWCVCWLMLSNVIFFYSFRWHIKYTRYANSIDLEKGNIFFGIFSIYILCMYVAWFYRKPMYPACIIWYIIRIHEHV